VFHRYLEHQTDHLPFGLPVRLYNDRLGDPGSAFSRCRRSMQGWVCPTFFEEAIELNEA
jgi:hypothetical protein